MGSQKRRDEYFAKANDADHQAAISKDPYVQERLLRIAATYRDLAALTPVRRKIN
jgi:hypothetical protein